MKTKRNIRTVIRQIVREEVAMAINEVITELKQPTQQVSQPKPKVVEGKRVYKKFTDNSVLNDVLNETAQSDEWKQMGDGTYDSSKMNEVLSSQYGELMNGGGEVNADAMVASMGIEPTSVVDPVKKALSRDYSELVKAFDKKKGQGKGA